ncbi:DUF4232 domain-containing protein [Cellulosimicrobium marinum]|uniref:DUF4232 domain-containing protein n=1 Tax=Cellulosimicrobium marinum TaxID=1638992 RepID=UPI001E524C7F|nr:DUF4232 domain-containing protein [Cellulosimicrobium marinum]MCB7136272.1 DUF4232 domain-containing protein [Cellulosimicrobium marinum]
MDDERTRRSRAAIGTAVAGIALAVTAAALAPAVLREGAAAEARASQVAGGPENAAASPTDEAPDGEPTLGADPERWVEDTTALLEALPGVADVEMNGWAGASARVTLATPLPSPETAQRTADDARAILQSSRGGETWELRVLGSAASGATLQVVDGTTARGTRGTDPTTGDPLPDLLGDAPVAFAVALLADGTVRSVGLDASYASVEVADAAALTPVATTFRDAERPLSALSTIGYDVTLSLGDPPVPADAALLDLVTAASSRPGVASVSYEARRPVLPGTPLLTVYADGDPLPVARWLEGTADAGAPLGFQVHGPDGAAVRSGYVGGVAPGVPTDGTTCDADLLTLDAAWFDAALGRRFLTVTARNDDDAPCVLGGSPALRFVASDGTEQDVLVEADAIAVGAPVTLAPGDRAQSTLSWRGGPTAHDPALVTSLLVAPVPGTPESVVAFADVPGADRGLDLLDGGTATVTPWSPWVEPGPP